jgi:ABC-type antimicrobial peptide transport system permease subunit
VTQRIPEIGIRLALGATRASMCRAVVGGAVMLTAGGALLGTLASVAAGPLIKGLLFDTSTTDAMTYAMVIAAVMTLTAAASIAPARRAMRVDPMIALRNE